MGLTSEQIKDKSRKRAREIVQDSHYKSSEVLYIYLPDGAENEIDTQYLIVKALQDGKIIASPIFISSQDRVFARIDGNPGFRRGRRNSLEPLYQTKLVIDKPGLRIVPREKIAEEDRNGIHYYENYLSNRKNLYTIAVGYQNDRNNIEKEKHLPIFHQVRLY